MSISDPTQVPVRDAATVMLVRDGNSGLEVFMLRRNPKSVFVGGAFVFPGGAVDEADRFDPDLESVVTGLSDEMASARLGIESGGLAFWVAAIRESFEEAGLLLANNGNGQPLRLEGDAMTTRFGSHRLAVDSGAERLVDVCKKESLILACDEIHYFSHWITPVGPPRRFDTRFFIARAPEGQTGKHDDSETVASLWTRPQDALNKAAAGELEVIQPTIRNLEAIARFSSTQELMAAAAAMTNIPAILPRLVQEDGGVRILLPGDRGYSDVEALNDVLLQSGVNK